MTSRTCGHSTGDDQDCGHSTGMTETANTVEEMNRDCGHSRGYETVDCGQQYRG
ncbi:unnamed protein product [Staurois parvus]|uniref:Uncharacterized protein n=1 Tax=Staurois parvus TaxID=386267 RepID=A0ABN9BZA0_9NEOB|nr:unnamed protein product [Staurois parvus]